MKSIKLLAILLILLVVGTVIADDQPQKVMNFIAVMDLKCGKSIEKDQCSALTDIVIQELVKIKKYRVIDRANRDKILSEVGFQQTGCVEGSCTVEAGRVLGVGKIVVGSITRLGDTYLVNLQLVNVETAEVELGVDQQCKQCKLADLVNTLKNAARKLMGEEFSSTTSSQSVPNSPDRVPKPEEIKFIAATPEQRKLCPENMVYVPAGWFMMGCNASIDTLCMSDEKPYHPVYLKAFCIDTYEYSNRKNTSPVGGVKWLQAQSICTTGGKRLPTEAEWEKAARGTNGRVYPWDGPLDSTKATFNTKRGPAFSGSRPMNRSPYGAYDMAGNLWEWVADIYGANYYSNSPPHNPTGPVTGSNHVLRGGAYYYAANYLRTSARIGVITGPFRWETVGFRCAKDAE